MPILFVFSIFFESTEGRSGGNDWIVSSQKKKFCQEGVQNNNRKGLRAGLRAAGYGLRAADCSSRAAIGCRHVSSLTRLHRRLLFWLDGASGLPGN